MKVLETSSFIFAFRGQSSKANSYERLKQFLKENDWLSNMDVKIEPLSDYHSDNNGICYITLASEILSDDFTSNSEKLFHALVNDSTVEWIKVRYTDSTEGIVYNNVDFYGNFHQSEISEMKKGDIVLVHKK